MAPLLFGVLSTLLLSSPPNPQQQSSQLKILEVCLSPGCIADGAEETLSRLCAFAPPNTKVSPGKCASACGAGPVVLKGVAVEDGIDDEKRTVCKRVAGDALLKLLQGNDDDDENSFRVPDDIIKGYELTIQANDAMSRKEYNEAASLYHEGIEMALTTALKLHGSKEAKGVNKSSSASSSYSPGLEWLIRAYRLEAEATIQQQTRSNMKDTSKKALELAQKGWELSHRTDRLCLELMARACQDLGDLDGELNALKTLLVEMEPEEDAPRDVMNRRRELGFRLAKLEREAKA